MLAAGSYPTRQEQTGLQGYLELSLQKEYGYCLEVEKEENVLCRTQSPPSAVSVLRPVPNLNWLQPEQHLGLWHQGHGGGGATVCLCLRILGLGLRTTRTLPTFSIKLLVATFTKTKGSTSLA